MMTPPMTTPTAMPPTVPDSAPPAQPVHPSRFGLFFGIVASVLTLAAIALAVFAPQLTSAPKLQVPVGWQQVYSANPGDTTGAWDNAVGCDFPSEGLAIESDSSCKFQPRNDATLDGGVLIDAQLAPAADVPTSEDAGILLDNSLLVIITQQGDYQICHDTCDSSFTAGDFQPSGLVASGSTVAWHADAFVPNEIAVLYNADQDTVAFYANGQFVDQASADISSSPTIALTTSSSGEALFTHVTHLRGQRVLTSKGFTATKPAGDILQRASLSILSADGCVCAASLRDENGTMPRIDPERTLETPRLLLEPLVVGHATALFEAHQAPDLYTYIPQDPPSSLEALTTRFSALASRRSPDGQEDWLNWALRQHATGDYVGTIQATVLANHTALLAYMVFVPFWRQGYALESCTRVLAHLFEDYHVSRVAAEIDTRNTASIQLVEALGFTLVATTHGADFFKGSVSDEYRYEVSAPALRKGSW